jgi:sec-independent protein translocase protein TatA
MGGIGTGELVIILLIVLVFFGGAKLPGLARSLGQAQREFRKGNVEGLEDDDAAKDDKPVT